MASDTVPNPATRDDPWSAFAAAMAIATQNANNAHQQGMVTCLSTTTMGVATLYSIDTAITGIATQAMAQK